jgi:cell wall-associated NlpC family hydrolase
MMDDATRQAVVAEARTWVGTPYHHQADVKGHGVDCIMILVCIYGRMLKLLPEDFDPRPYPQHWFLHRGEERYLNGILQFCDQVETPNLADISLYRVGRTVSHAVINIGDGYVIHASAPARQVEITERRFIDHQLDSHWTLK